MPGNVVVQVDGNSITKATLDHWTAVEAIVSSQISPSQSVPKGLVQDPPNYVNCIAYLEASEPKPVQGQSKPTPAQLKSQCEQKYELLQHHILDILITDYWFEGEAAAKGVKVSGQELEQALHRQFPSEAAFHRFLAFTGEKPSDEMLVLKRELLIAKFEEKAITKKGLTAAQQQQAFVNFTNELTRRWTGRTNCRSGYVVTECKQFRGSKTL